jgi:two-component system OmpR family response regulator
VTRCLLVDDDAAIRTLVGDYLAQHGMQVQALDCGAALRRLLPASETDVLLLDLMLPDADGLALCRWAKQLRPGLPVLMLTALGDPVSRVLGLELGADDYIAKPFEPRELVARIRATLRRGRLAVAAAPATEQQLQGFVFDRVRRLLRGPDGTVFVLSAAEFRLLAALVDHAGQALSRERLLALTRVPGDQASVRSIDLVVSRLRSKLGDAPNGQPLIRTLRGEGYAFDAALLR